MRKIKEKTIFKCWVCEGKCLIDAWVCPKCEGRGYVDWVENARRTPIDTDGPVESGYVFPEDPETGMVFYNYGIRRLFIYTGTKWKAI